MPGLRRAMGECEGKGGESPGGPLPRPPDLMQVKEGQPGPGYPRPAQGRRREMGNSDAVSGRSQGAMRALRGREALMFHAIFLVPTLMIAALAVLELALRLWHLLG